MNYEKAARLTRDAVEHPEKYPEPSASLPATPEKKTAKKGPPHMGTEKSASEPKLDYLRAWERKFDK